MEKRSKMELFERIRLDRVRDPEVSIRELERRYRVHRREIRLALSTTEPPPTRKRHDRGSPKLGLFHELIDEWLVADQKVPRKQRHTARRIWQRLVEEQGADVTERAVSKHVRERRRALGFGMEGFVPQVHEPGVEGEVDWGESTVIIAGVPTVVHHFVMRASHSGAAFVQVFPHETQQAFLEAHVEAFEFFGGVFQTIWYDNLTSAVKRVLRGRRRVESDRFATFRAYFGYESEFTLVGLRGAHEKGGVEGEVGRFRRRHMVPVPQVETLGELNQMLLAACVKDLRRRITGRDEAVGDALDRERPLLRPAPEFEFVTFDVLDARVDAKSMVCVRQNHYSVPSRLIGQRIQVRVHARSVEMFSAQRLVAIHGRLSGRHGHAATVDHYLDVMVRKPGALAGSRALAQDRERGMWPPVYDELWQEIAQRHGPSIAARQMVDVLLLCREVGPERVEHAARDALESGAYDGRAVAVLARRTSEQPVARLTDLDDRLTRVGSPTPNLLNYDTLLPEGDSQ